MVTKLISSADPNSQFPLKTIYSSYDNTILLDDALDSELSVSSNRGVKNHTIALKFQEIESALGSYITDVATLVGGDA